MEWHRLNEESWAYGEAGRYHVRPEVAQGFTGWRVDLVSRGGRSSRLVGVSPSDKMVVRMAERHNMANGGD
jgi:hypothetical protein